ncbi:MAG: DUF6044 family protein [Phaeospirillum sp.]|nr:DUF6044 family protein [Phaeospirillum sp.]
MRPNRSFPVPFDLDRPALIFLAAALVMAVLSYGLGPASFMRWHDLGDSHLTRYMATAATVKAVGLHSLFPWAASGVDLEATGTRTTDAFLLLFLILPGWAAIAAMRVAQLFIAGYFMDRLLDRHLGLPRWAAVCGGLFHLLLQENMLEHYFGIGAIPLILYVLTGLLARRPWQGLALAGLAGLIYSQFVFAPLTVVFLPPLLAGWLIAMRPRQWPLALGVGAAFSLAAVVGQVDMVAAMAVNGPLSHRIGHGFQMPWKIIGGPRILSQPVLWIGLIGIMAARGDRRMGWALLGGLTGIVALMIVQHPIRLLLAPHIPLAAAFTGYRFFVDAPVLMAGLAAWGLERMVARLRGDGGWTRKTRGVVATALLAAAALPLMQMAEDARTWIQWGGYRANLEAPALKRLAAETRADDPFRVATIQENGLQAGFMNAYPLETADGYINLYPRQYHELWELVIEPYLARSPEIARYFTENGARISLYTDDGHSLPLPVERYFRTPLLALLNVRYLVTTVPLDDAGLELLPETRPDRWWDELTTGEKIRRRLGENVHGRHVALYRVKDAVARYRLVGTVRLHDNRAGMEAALRTASTLDLEHEAHLWRADAPRLGLAEGAVLGKGEVRIQRATPDRVELNVETDAPGLLVAANAFSPFWRADIDNAPATLTPAYGGVMAVAVPAGRHTVTLTYRPPYLPGGGAR